MEMYSHQLICLLVGTLFFCSIMLPIPCLAEEENGRVDAIFNIEFDTATDFIIHVEMDVHKITVFETLNKTQIKNAEPEEMGAIKYSLRQAAEEQIEQTFSPEIDDNIKAIMEKPTYENEMFYDDFQVNLSAAFFNMEKASRVGDLVNGLLDVGAVVPYSFDFKAKAGWNSTYMAVLNDYMKFQNATMGKYDQNSNTISWKLNNYDENMPKIINGQLSIAHANPTSLPKEEKVRLEQILDISETQKPKLVTQLFLESIDIQKYAVLPQFLSAIDFVPADCIRLLNKSRLLSYNALKNNTVEPIVENVTSSLETILNQSIDLSFSWNLSTTLNCSQPYNTRKMDDIPPIAAELQTSNIALKIKEMPLRGVMGLLHAGGKLNITSHDLAFDEVPYPHEGQLILPQNITLDGSTTYLWNNTHPIRGEMDSQVAPNYEKEEKKLTVRWEITKTDLNLLDLFKGETKLTFNSAVENTLMLHVIKNPEIFGITYLSPDYLNADAIRLIIEEKMASDAMVKDFLSSYKSILEEKTNMVSQAKQAKNYIDKKSFYDSLRWDGNIHDMDGEKPVNITLRSTMSYSLPLEVSAFPPNGHVSNQSFNLSGAPNYPVDYQIVFPEGMKVQVNPNQTDVEIGVTNDGREYLSVSFAAGEKITGTEVNCSIKVSSLFLVFIFQPCIIGAVILIIFIAIVYLLRKRRGGGRPAFFRRKPWERSKRRDEYPDEEYYIPPPPGRE